MFVARDERRFGSILAALETFVAGLEPGEYSPSGVHVVLEQVAKAEKLCGAARLLLSKRAASLLDDRNDGHASAAKWFAEHQGTSINQAKRELELADALEQQPELAGALRAGRLSPEQAGVILPAVEAEPASAPELIETAGREPLGVLRGRSRAVVAGSRSEADAKAHAVRQHMRRFLELGVTDDGMLSLRGELPPVEGAALRTALEREARRVFDEARRAGSREPHRAYMADALVGLCRGGVFKSGVPQAELMLVCDAEAVRRGETAEGQTCEIRGVGRVPMATLEYLFGSSWAKAIIRDGVDVASVTHLHRTIPAHLRTALLMRDPTCIVPGCGVSWGLEIDHLVPIKDGGVTELANLAPACGRHHFLKTYCGWAFVGRPGDWDFVQLRAGEKIARVADRIVIVPDPGAIRPTADVGDLDVDELFAEEADDLGAQLTLCCRSRRPSVTVRVGSAPIRSRRVAAARVGPRQLAFDTASRSPRTGRSFRCDLRSTPAAVGHLVAGRAHAGAIRAGP